MSKLAQDVQKAVDELRSKRPRKPEPVPPKRKIAKRGKRR